MANTYNTLNPLGSTSAKDLSDNASNFDEVMNSLSPSFYDRFKRRRETWAGMEKMVNDFLEAMGFEATHLVYVDGTPLTVLRPTQLIDRAGSVYKVKMPASFPVNLTGTWATDQLLLVDVGDASLRMALANASDPALGAAMIGYKGGTVADSLPVYGWQFGVLADGSNDTAALQAAINWASTNNRELRLQGLMTVTPATAMTDEAGANLAALLLRSNLRIVGEPLATIRISNGVSTDLSPTRHSMFFSNEFLENIEIVGITMDMNGANNPISPNRGTFVYNRFTNAQIIFSGTPGGVAAGANNVLIERCQFINNAGVSCIVMAQSNTPGAVLGNSWKLLRNTFYNVGLDTDDHSSIFAWATDVQMSGNTFDNPAQYNGTLHTGGFVAVEIHGSRSRFVDNAIRNYRQGLWVASNLTEASVSGTVISNNYAEVSLTLVDFYSANLDIPSWVPYESVLHNTNIEGNTVLITNGVVEEAVKAAFKIAAVNGPNRVIISNNTVRSFEIAKTCVLALVLADARQITAADQIVIRDNVAAGIHAGVIGYFGSLTASKNINKLSVIDNDLGVLVSGGAYPNCDVYLYGPQTGSVADLRLGGLQSTAPVQTDGVVSRARCFGRAILPTVPVWNGITLGAAVVSSQVALDTDSGGVEIALRLQGGAGTVATGVVFPSLPGILASKGSALSASHHLTAGTHKEFIEATIQATSPNISLQNASGPLVSTTVLDTSVLYVGGRVPCAFADI